MKGPRRKDNYETIYIKLIPLFIETNVHQSYYLVPIKACLYKLFSLPYLVLLAQPSNLTIAHKKNTGAGGMNFAEQNFAMESISIIFENLLSRFRVKIAKINSAKITACEYFCSLAT